MTVSETIQAGLNALRINTKDILTQEEAAIYTGLSVSYIYQLTCAREIPHYKQGRRNIFRRSELDEWMTAVKIHTNDENRQRAEAYEIINKEKQQTNKPKR